MKQSNYSVRAAFRMSLLAMCALVLAACGGGSSDGTTGGDVGGSEVDNPDNIDVNGDGFLDSLDDQNADGVVDQTDVDLYALNNEPTDPNAQDGNILPDCTVKDCNSNNSVWSDNAVIAQNRSPVSTYALAIQRIMYCLSYGGNDTDGIGGFSDGIYGSLTADAVQLYQTDKQLLSDGIVGQDTWDALQADLSDPIAVDNEFNGFGVVSSRVGCVDQNDQPLILFYQRVAQPMGWLMASEPGSAAKIPMSANSADLP